MENSGAIKKLLHGRGLHEGIIFDEYVRYLESRMKLGAYEAEFLDLIGPKGSKGINLDVGCGVSRIVNTGAPNEEVYVGIDLDLEMLQTAQRVTSGNISRLCADATRMPFKSDCFEKVYAIDLLEHVSDKRKTLSEMKRVLKPDGLLLLAVWNKLWPFEPHTFLPFMSYLPTRLVDRICRRTRTGFLKWFKSYRFVNLPTYQELINLLTEADLSFSIWPRIEGYVITPRIILPPIGELDMRYYIETRKGKYLFENHALHHKHIALRLALAHILITLLKRRLLRWICTSWIVVAKSSVAID